MSDERQQAIEKITRDITDIIGTHVSREMANASDEEIAAFQTFVERERAAVKEPSPSPEQDGGSDLLDLIMQRAREYKKKN